MGNEELWARLGGRKDLSLGRGNKIGKMDCKEPYMTGKGLWGLDSVGNGET